MTHSFDSYIGPGAGLATSFLWTATALFFTAAVRRLGTIVLNSVRILFAIVLLVLTHRGVTGQWFPDLHARQTVYLALSGIVGLTIGDQALFRAFMDIGPRITMLIMTTSPLFAALLGWVVLGERLAPTAWIGILMTISGVGWVVFERPKVIGEVQRDPHRVRGFLLACMGAFCQAAGLLLSKQGIGHGWLPSEQHMSPQAATMVRMVFAGVGMIPLIAYHWGNRRRLEHRSEQANSAPIEDAQSTERRGTIFRTGITLAFCGAIVGPFLGVWMSLVATDRLPLGVAQTLCSLTPILILPFAATLHREHIGARAINGAVLAVLGVTILFLRQS